jgi:hypothetical protein
MRNQQSVLPPTPRDLCGLTSRTWGLSASGGSAETVGMAYGKTFQAVSVVL